MSIEFWTMAQEGLEGRVPMYSAAHDKPSPPKKLDMTGLRT